MSDPRAAPVYYSPGQHAAAPAAAPAHYAPQVAPAAAPVPVPAGAYYGPPPGHLGATAPGGTHPPTSGAYYSAQAPQHHFPPQQQPQQYPPQQHPQPQPGGVVHYVNPAHPNGAAPHMTGSGAPAHQVPPAGGGGGAYFNPHAPTPAPAPAPVSVSHVVPVQQQQQQQQQQPPPQRQPGSEKNYWPGPHPNKLKNISNEALFWDEAMLKKSIPRVLSFKGFRTIVKFLLELADPVTDALFLHALITTACFEDVAYPADGQSFAKVRNWCFVAVIVGCIVTVSKLWDLAANYSGNVVQRMVTRDYLRLAIVREMSAKSTIAGAQKNPLTQCACGLCIFIKQKAEMALCDYHHVLTVFFPLLRFLLEDTVQFIVTLVHIKVVRNASNIAYLTLLTTLCSLTWTLVKVGINQFKGSREGARRVLKDPNVGWFTKARATCVVSCGWISFGFLLLYIAAVFIGLFSVVIITVRDSRDRDDRC